MSSFFSHLYLSIYPKCLQKSIEQPLGWLYAKKQIITSVDKDVEKVEPLYTTNENAKCAVTLENSLAVPQMIIE